MHAHQVTAGSQPLTTAEFWEAYHRGRGSPRALPLGIRVYQRLDRLFQAHLPKGRRRFLEVGCGSSMWLSYFHRAFGYDVYGLDPSALGCRNARRYVQSRGGRVGLVQGDLFRSPWRSGAFQVVFSMGFLEHFDRPEAAVAAHAELVERGGSIAVVVPNLQGMDGWLLRHLNPKVFRIHCPISPGDLKEWVRTAGMEASFSGYAGGLGLFLLGIRHPAISSTLHAGLRRIWYGLHGLAWRSLDRNGRWPDSAAWSPFVVCVAQKGAT